MYKVKINENLKNSILSTIPENYSNLEKALYIYKQLCFKLQYSMDYFIDENRVKKDFTNIDNLQYVDGEQNKDVVCFTFNAILGELLYDANICQRINFDFGNGSKNFSFFHESVYVSIDGIEYDIDATYGILDNNDLTLSKYSAHKPSGWLPCEPKKEYKEVLDKAIEKVYGEEIKHQQNVDKYVSLKQKEGSYLNLPFEERVNLFFEMLKDVPEYSVVAFNYLIKLKHLLFKEEEFKNSNQVDKMIDLCFVKDRETNSFKALLFVNPKGYTNDRGYENFNSLSIYEIDMQNKSYEQLDLETARKRINTRHYISHRDDKTLSYFSMMSDGKLYVYPITDGPPIYDHHQNVVNATGYERRLIKENKTVPYEMGKGE